MISTELIITPEIKGKLSMYDSLGGVMDFKVLRVENASNEKEAHLAVAQKTLELVAVAIAKDFAALPDMPGVDRNKLFKMTVSALSLTDGSKVTPLEFFGPFFQFEAQRSILREETGRRDGDIILYSDLHYFDDAEIPPNVVTVQTNNDSPFVIQGYADAFFNPPHGFGGHMTNLEKGKFFLDFNRLFFDDISQITVYSWPIDCSNYFDEGKEYWGSFFWTVYNPIKDWFVGIVASTTD